MKKGLIKNVIFCLIIILVPLIIQAEIKKNSPLFNSKITKENLKEKLVQSEKIILKGLKAANETSPEIIFNQLILNADNAIEVALPQETSFDYIILEDGKIFRDIASKNWVNGFLIVTDYRCFFIVAELGHIAALPIKKTNVLIEITPYEKAPPKEEIAPKDSTITPKNSAKENLSEESSSKEEFPPLRPPESWIATWHGWWLNEGYRQNYYHYYHYYYQPQLGQTHQSQHSWWTKKSQLRQKPKGGTRPPEKK